LLVIAVVDPNGSPAVTEAYLEMLKDMARLPYLQPYVQRDLVMGWLDGVRWAGFVKVGREGGEEGGKEGGRKGGHGRECSWWAGRMQ